MIRPTTALALALSLAFLPVTLATPAHAESDDTEAGSGSYWEMAFAGGMLMPLDQMSELHQQSMAGSARVGWISRLGLGFDLTLDYSPLSRKQTATDDIFDVQFVTAGVMPRFTLGKKTIRLWLAGGGAMAYEHSVHVESVTGMLGPTTNKLAAAGMGAAGLELYAFSGVGVAVIGSYMRTVMGDLDYQLINVTGGLAVTFR